jgi:hypothetical protein
LHFVILKEVQMQGRLNALGRVSVLAIALGLLVACVSAATASAAEVEWRQGAGALASAVEYKSSGTFKLIDSGRSGGAFSLSCTMSGEGKAGPGAAGEVTKFLLNTCNNPATECEAAKGLEFEFLNLPWHTALVIVEGKPRDVISSGGKGAPGLRVYCTVFGKVGTLVEECSGTLKTSATNTTSGVEGSFDGEQLSCKHETVASKGTVEGSLLTQSKSGAALEVTRPENWLQGGKALTGSIATKTSGTVKLTDEASTGGVLSVECKDTGGGSAGTSGSDELTKLSFSSCKLVSDGPCEAAVTPNIVPLHLPWHSELVLSEGLTPRTHDVSLSGGSGLPGLRIECRIGGIFYIADECTASALKTSAKNVSAGVEGVFDGEKLTCTASSKKGTGVLEGTHLIEANTSSALEVEFP